MNLSLLARRNLAHYWRTNIAVVLGVAAAVAVLSGALMVGDSVRGSLRDLVAQRLGRTDYIVSTMLFFREALAKDIPFSAPLIAIEGVAVHDADKRASSAQVYGIDDRFWKFHGVTADANAGSDARISSALASEIGAKAGDTILVRVEKPTAIAKESMHGRKDDATRVIRFQVGAILDAAHLGEFSLRPTQGSVRAIFVPLRRLQRDLQQAGKVNALLTAGGSPLAALREHATFADLGIKLRALPESNSLSVESDSAAISDSSLHTETINEARVAMRLVNSDGDVIWTTSQESKGGKYKGASADVADNCVKQLLRDVAKTEGGTSTPISAASAR